MMIKLKSRSIGFSGVFWVYSGASLVMALYAYLVDSLKNIFIEFSFHHLLFHGTLRLFRKNIFFLLEQFKVSALTSKFPPGDSR